MSSLFSSGISQTAFNDSRIQATGEKRWADLDSEAKKEIISSVAKAVAAVFIAIILTGAIAGLCVGIAFGIVPLVAVLPTAAMSATVMWTLAGCAIKDAVKTVQKHLPPNPNLNDQGVEVVG